MAKLVMVSLAALLLVGCKTAPSTSDPLPADAAAAGEGCNTPLGFIPEGRSATGYLHQIEQSGQSCQQGTIECHEGAWTGVYIYPSCTRLP